MPFSKHCRRKSGPAADWMNQNLQRTFGCLDDMTDQNRRCDGADTAGNRSDRADNRLNLGKDRVARDGARPRPDLRSHLQLRNLSV